jgi:hypothetical protein
MSSFDQENLRRAELEIRNSVGSSNEGSGAMWFLAVVVIAAVVGGIYVYGADSDGTGAVAEEAPAAIQETAPLVTPTE